MLSTVAAVVLPGVAPFELGVLCEVFGIDRSREGLPNFDFRVVTGTPGPVSTSLGFTLDGLEGLDFAGSADLVAVPAYTPYGTLPPEVGTLLRDTVARGATVLSVCSGAYALAQAGLLDGRRCTTHWMYSADLAARFPAALVDPAVLYVDAGPVITSAGTAAGIDACLHLVRRELGAEVARGIARRMVVPPHRDGGQAQFVETPVQMRAAATLEGTLVWMSEHLDQEMTVEHLAARAHMSPRTFARRFRAETGTTPMAWITGQRVTLAQRLLERTDDPVEVVAAKSGFGTAAVLRHHFSRVRGTTPHSYRRAFARRPA